MLRLTEAGVDTQVPLGAALNIGTIDGAVFGEVYERCRR